MTEGGRMIVDVDKFQFSIWGLSADSEEFGTELADYVAELSCIVVHTGQDYGPAEVVVEPRTAPGPGSQGSS